MRNQIRIAKAIVTASCVLAIALLTIGMDVNSAWAQSDQSSRSFSPRSTSRVAYCGAVGAVAHKMDCSDCCVHKCGFNANHTYVCN